MTPGSSSYLWEMMDRVISSGLLGLDKARSCKKNGLGSSWLLSIRFLSTFLKEEIASYLGSFWPKLVLQRQLRE